MIVNFTLTGITDLLMHKDDVEANDELREEREAIKAADAKPGNKKGLSVAGDDRSPPWTWMTYLYHDDESIAMPSDNIMSTLKWAATKMPMPGGKANANLKQVSQSGILIDTPFCAFADDGKRIAMADVLKLKGRTFSEQKKAVQKMGFDLLVKRAAVNNKKHVRVRAQFRRWQVAGSLLVSDGSISFPILAEMFDLAGDRSGLCDWRPSSKMSSGPYGRFRAELKQVTR